MYTEVRFTCDSSCSRIIWARSELPKSPSPADRLWLVNHHITTERISAFSSQRSTENRNMYKYVKKCHWSVSEKASEPGPWGSDSGRLRTGPFEAVWSKFGPGDEATVGATAEGRKEGELSDVSSMSVFWRSVPQPELNFKQIKSGASDITCRHSTCAKEPLQHEHLWKPRMERRGRHFYLLDSSFGWHRQVPVDSLEPPKSQNICCLGLSRNWDARQCLAYLFIPFFIRFHISFGSSVPNSSCFWSPELLSRGNSVPPWKTSSSRSQCSWSPLGLWPWWVTFMGCFDPKKRSFFFLKTQKRNQCHSFSKMG